MLLQTEGIFIKRCNEERYSRNCFFKKNHKTQVPRKNGYLGLTFFWSMFSGKLFQI
jgi:hypothetical protein